MTQESPAREYQTENDAAMESLFAASYSDLRKLARSRLRASGPSTLLDTTSLVHESYLRLASAGSLHLKDRVHLLSYAGRAMRSVVVDLVRRRRAARNDGGARVTLSSEAGVGATRGDEEILRVHQALDELQQYDQRMVQVVEMRYFAGMTEVEIAEALGVTERTIRRDWEKARLWLAQALS
jgi:RNA polymerase sigma factor (TIGR02999 family)